MAENTAEIPFLMNIGFLITYKCQIRCPHCLVKAGPDREEAMSLEDTLDWIDQTARYGNGKIKVVSFTGGEPFYDIEMFRKIIDYTVSRGLVPTAVTNAFWADTESGAVEILKSMPALSFLSISTDEHHLKCISLEKIKNAINAAERCNRVYTVTVSAENEKSERHLQLLKSLHEITDPSRIGTVITFPVGRAKNTIDPSSYQMTRELPLSACGDAHTPVIFPDGHVSACIGPIIDIAHDHPLMLGNLRTESLAAILDRAEKNTILHLIRTWGPSYLYTLLKENGCEVETNREYIKDSICSLCYSLMNNRALAQALHELGTGKELTEKTAWARKHYMNETAMLEALDLSV